MPALMPHATRWALIRVEIIYTAHGKGRHVRKCRPMPTGRSREKRRFLKSEHNNQNSDTL